MNPLDEELKNLLKRREPPEGFAERVMVRIETEPRRLTPSQRVAALFWRPVLRWVAVAAVVCVVAVAGIVRYEREQRLRAQAELASRQAIFALRFTNEEIEAALARAQHVTVRALEVRRNLKQEME
jgi:negative regulator of sigma E activity